MPPASVSSTGCAPSCRRSAYWRSSCRTWSAPAPDPDRRRLLGLTAVGLASGGRALARCEVARLTLTDTQGYLSLPATMEGRPVTLLLDTGADGSLILPEAAQALHLRRDPGRTTRMQGTGGNGAVVGHAVIHELGLGGLRMLDASLPVAPLPSIPRLSPPVAGLLGGDVLARFNVEVALPDQRLTLREVSPGCLPARPAEGLAATRSGNRLIIAVELEGQPLRALVDTGARSILLSTAAAARLGVTAAMLAADPGGVTSGVDLQPTEFHWHQFSRLRIGDELQPSVTLTVAPLDEAADMLLGAPFFAAHRVVLSYAAGLVSVQRLG